MVTVGELIEQLKEFDPKTPVYVNADHGQTNIQCAGAFQSYFGELEYYGEEAWDEDGDELDETAIPVCIIGD